MNQGAFSPGLCPGICVETADYQTDRGWWYLTMPYQERQRIDSLSWVVSVATNLVPTLVTKKEDGTYTAQNQPRVEHQPTRGVIDEC
jgi:hypothetical protein